MEAIASPPGAPRRPTPYEPANPAEEVVAQRRSVRAFLDTPVPRATVERILALAARAPSGTNMQPWRAHVLTGAARDRLCDAVIAAFDGPERHANEWAYYPKEFREPYLARRRKVGWDLYGLLGIARGESERDRKSTRLNSSHSCASRMPSSA